MRCWGCVGDAQRYKPVILSGLTVRDKQLEIHSGTSYDASSSSKIAYCSVVSAIRVCDRSSFNDFMSCDESACRFMTVRSCPIADQADTEHDDTATLTATAMLDG